MKNFITLIIFLITLTLSLNTSAQSLVDDLVDDSGQDYQTPELATETIKKFSPTGKIFIMTNNAQSFRKGDFVTLIISNERAVRCLVAKTSNENIAGLKIMKIYSLDLYKRVKPNKEVLVLRGDDSFYRKKTAEAVGTQISDEDDLFNETTLLQEDVTLDENTKRVIKTDNIVSLGMGLVSGTDVDGAAERYAHYMGLWAYQFEDNMWGELVFGKHEIGDFPVDQLSTSVTNITLRFKYTFSAPFYSYIKPYIGYQVISADSPAAGEKQGNETADDLAAEVARVENQTSNGLVFGVTWLKRLVPGWFLRADLGSDVLGVGFALEF